MSEKKQYKKPTATVADGVIAPCQKCIRVYPTRLTLKDSAFQNIQEGKVPVLPEGVPYAGDDYALRRLRPGYVYILATKAESESFPISGEADNNQAWYIYSYISNNEKQGFRRWNLVSFNLEKEKQASKVDIDEDDETNHQNSISSTQDGISSTQDNSSSTQDGSSSAQDDISSEQEPPTKDYLAKATIKTVAVKGKAMLRDCIELNPAISTAYIMYSDFELPHRLLKEIEQSPKSRDIWMRKINIQAPSGATADLQKLTDIVADFSLKDLDINNQTSNHYRYTPIGRLKNSQTVANRITNGKGIIVALEDSIGTIRDLACYHGYLDKKREEILAKYEYAIRTATFIHSHAQAKILYNFNQQKERSKAVQDVIGNKNPWYTDFPKEWERVYKKPMPLPVAKEITLAQSYKEYTKVAPIHLKKDSHNDIFSSLIRELKLEDIPGENAIHKMANLPGLYGIHFKHVAETHIKLINTNYRRFESLFSLLDKEDETSAYIANAFCLFTHGLLWGLDVSSYGFNACVTALGKSLGEELNPIKPLVSNDTVQLLQNIVKLFGKSLEVLEALAKRTVFSIAAYDLVVDVLITKHSALANPNNLTKVGKGGHLVHWKRVYEVNPLAKRYTHTDQFIASSKRIKGDVVNNITWKNSLPNEYAHFNVGNGLILLQTFEVFLGFFNTQQYRTKAGQIANDPFLAAALALAGSKSTPILDNFKAKIDKSRKDITPKLVNPGIATHPHKQNLKLTNFKITSLSDAPMLRQITSSLVSANTALVFLNTLVEYGNWYEARYKNDVLGQNAAMLRGFGGVVFSSSYGVLGLLAENALMASGIATAATVGLWIGGAAVVIGVILGAFSKDDMDSWMENSFWGGSPNYWGNPIRGYEWDRKRIDDFLDLVKKSQFQYIENTNGLSLSEASQEVFKNYEIELQRYFAFKENIKLSKYESPNAVLVEHPSINNNAMAQSIRVDSQITVMTEYAHYSSTQQPERIVFIENGKAVIYFPSSWKGISWEITGTRKEKAQMETIDPSSVKSIRLKVYLADYQGSGGKISSDLTTIPMK